MKGTSAPSNQLKTNWSNRLALYSLSSLRDGRLIWGLHNVVIFYFILFHLKELKRIFTRIQPWKKIVIALQVHWVQMNIFTGCVHHSACRYRGRFYLLQNSVRKLRTHAASLSKNKARLEHKVVCFIHSRRHLHHSNWPLKWNLSTPGYNQTFSAFANSFCYC